VADGADWRFGTAEELPAVTTYARVVAGIVSDVRILAYLLPIAGRDLVTRNARALVLSSAMKKF
jgi:hypothetical protein